MFRILRARRIRNIRHIGRKIKFGLQVLGVNVKIRKTLSFVSTKPTSNVIRWLEKTMNVNQRQIYVPGSNYEEISKK